MLVKPGCPHDLHHYKPEMVKTFSVKHTRHWKKVTMEYFGGLFLVFRDHLMTLCNIPMMTRVLFLVAFVTSVVHPIQEDAFHWQLWIGHWVINAEIAPSYVIVRLDIVSEPLLRLDLAILTMNVRSNIRWHIQRNVGELLLLNARGTILQL